MSIIPNYVPNGYKVLNVFLLVNNTKKALEWYNRAFGAEEVVRLTDPNGVVVHAELKIADTIFSIAQEDPDFSRGLHNSVVLQLYMPDVEGFFEEAVKAGAEVVSPIQTQFYGDRSGKIKDPFGHVWIIATHVEDLTARELQHRFNELYS